MVPQKMVSICKFSAFGKAVRVLTAARAARLPNGE